MEDIYYLVHATNKPDCVNWKELRTGEFNTNDQFPGVYFSIITKDNIDTEKIFSQKYAMIFSKKLLQQKNYHINYRDCNGIITENNTYYSWNINDFSLKTKQQNDDKTEKMNEVVFHDNIDMKYCCAIIGILKKDIGIIKMNDILPRKVIENKEEPDMSKNPFLCYPFEDIYTGDVPLPKSSKEWFKTMAKVCKIDTNDNDTEEDIIKKIKDKSEELYLNRNNQDIKLLEEYTKNQLNTTTYTGGEQPTQEENKYRRHRKTKTQKHKNTKKNMSRKKDIFTK
jgi:hypothetical protein